MKTPLLSFLVLMGFVFAGCGAAEPAATPTPSKLQTVSIGVVTPSAAHAPLLVALAKDYFRDSGLQTDYQQFGNGELASAGLAGGHLDLAVTVPTVALFNEINRGLDSRIVSSMGAYPAQGEPAALVARKDLVDSGQVSALIDLKGRRVALGGGKGATQGYFTELLLHEAGMTLSDVQLVDLNFPDTVAALTNKSVDAAFLPDPFKAQAKQKAIATPIAKIGVPGHGGVVTLFSEKFAKERPDAAKAAMLSIVRGARDLQGDGVSSDDNLAAISQYTKLPVDVLKASDPYTYDPNLAPDVDSVLDMQQFFLATGQLGYITPLPADRLIDASFSKYAAQKLGS